MSETHKLPATKSKPRKLSPKVLKAVDAILTGQAKDKTEAAKIAGLSREHLTRTLNDPSITSVIAEIAQQRAKTLGTLKAMARLEHLLDNAKSEYVQADVAKHVAAIGGVSPSPARSQGTAAGVVFNIILKHREAAAPGVVIEHDPARDGHSQADGAGEL